jgi:hypothetical protein
MISGLESSKTRYGDSGESPKTNQPQTKQNLALLSAARSPTAGRERQQYRDQRSLARSQAVAQTAQCSHLTRKKIASPATGFKVQLL